ncbi:hypothetical protein NPIL_245891 [Nephila pilipes]|uniref:Uncharacterized protein n=1 Tax=Nephila pilipes TaxID=299642 RepID=A0A8X6KEU8_NEPPI|nr:hypothetical protein NPIL_245891 [Nephila pilipes]
MGDRGRGKLDLLMRSRFEVFRGAICLVSNNAAYTGDEAQLNEASVTRRFHHASGRSCTTVDDPFFCCSREVITPLRQGNRWFLTTLALHEKEQHPPTVSERIPGNGTENTTEGCRSNQNVNRRRDWGQGSGHCPGLVRVKEKLRTDRHRSALPLCACIDKTHLIMAKL